ncbi:MAG: ferrous iron transport protein A [DPANN group archaeon]|nr:ferrous iron transport protein A [DPANN group archaeon]
MRKTLAELGKKESGRILRVTCEGRIKRRLLDMGLVKGTLLEVQQIAPLGDPIEIKVKGYLLSLRKKEAGGIEVEIP